MHSRAEKEGRNPVFREVFDVVVSRGVAKLNQLAELTIPFCKLQGLVICLKGNNIDQELRSSEFASKILGAENVDVISVDYQENQLPDKLIVRFFRSLVTLTVLQLTLESSESGAVRSPPRLPR